MTREEVLRDMIYPALEEIRSTVDNGEQLRDSPETNLLGPASVLDSLSMVSLIVAIEERIEEKSGRAVTLANERAMSRKNSPFRTVGTLAEYIEEVLGS